MIGLTAGTVPNPDTIMMIMEHYLKERAEALCVEKTDAGRKGS